MQKLKLSALALFASIAISHAQLGFGLKAGVNYNTSGDLSETITSTSEDFISGAKGKTGFHAGIWLQAKLPLTGLYLRPEAVFTQIKSGYELQDGTKGNLKINKIDIPVLVGIKFVKIASLFLGPSFQYVLGSDFGVSDISKIDTNKFTVGAQFGAGLTLGKLGFDIRYERGLGKLETDIVRNNTNLKIDTRPSQVIFGLSYAFF